MGTKRIPIKRLRRAANDRERLKAWRWVFDAGYDFFGDLIPLGIVDPVGVWPPEKVPAAKQVFLKAAREAWDDLGQAFLEDYWTPRDADDRCWALQAFGPPR